MNKTLQLINSKNVQERSKMCTEVLGNKQGGKPSGWLLEVINTLRKIKGKLPLNKDHAGYEHQMLKSNAVLLLASYLEGDGV